MSMDHDERELLVQHLCTALRQPCEQQQHRVQRQQPGTAPVVGSGGSGCEPGEEFDMQLRVRVPVREGTFSPYDDRLSDGPCSAGEQLVSRVPSLTCCSAGPASSSLSAGTQFDMQPGGYSSAATASAHTASGRCSSPGGTVTALHRTRSQPLKRASFSGRQSPRPQWLLAELGGGVDLLTREQQQGSDSPPSPCSNYSHMASNPGRQLQQRKQQLTQLLVQVLSANPDSPAAQRVASMLLQQLAQANEQQQHEAGTDRRAQLAAALEVKHLLDQVAATVSPAFAAQLRRKVVGEVQAAADEAVAAGCRFDAVAELHNLLPALRTAVAAAMQLQQRVAAISTHGSSGPAAAAPVCLGRSSTSEDSSSKSSSMQTAHMVEAALTAAAATAVAEQQRRAGSVPPSSPTGGDAVAPSGSGSAELRCLTTADLDPFQGMMADGGFDIELLLQHELEAAVGPSSMHVMYSQSQQ